MGKGWQHARLELQRHARVACATGCAACATFGRSVQMISAHMQRRKLAHERVRLADEVRWQVLHNLWHSRRGQGNVMVLWTLRCYGVRCDRMR